MRKCINETKKDAMCSFDVKQVTGMLIDNNIYFVVDREKTGSFTHIDVVLKQGQTIPVELLKEIIKPSIDIREYYTSSVYNGIHFSVTIWYNEKDYAKHCEKFAKLKQQMIEFREMKKIAKKFF